jgi:hypothetical protein
MDGKRSFVSGVGLSLGFALLGLLASAGALAWTTTAAPSAAASPVPSPRVVSGAPELVVDESALESAAIGFGAHERGVLALVESDETTGCADNP